MVGWLVGFYPKGPRKGIFVSSKAHVSPPTRILSDQGDLENYKLYTWKLICRERKFLSTSNFCGSKCKEQISRSTTNSDQE